MTEVAAAQELVNGGKEGGAAEPAPSENVIVDLLTGEERKWSEREEIVQRMIRVLAEQAGCDEAPPSARARCSSSTSGARELAALSSLVARVPCYTLEVGSDLSTVPETISRLL